MGLRLGVRRVFPRTVFFVGCNGKGKKKVGEKGNFTGVSFTLKICVLCWSLAFQKGKKYKIKWQLSQNIVQQMTAWFLWTKKKWTKFPDSILGGAHFGTVIFGRKKTYGIDSTQPFQPKRGGRKRLAPGAAKGIAVSVPLGGFERAGKKLGGGNSDIFDFHPYLGKIPILTNIFQRGWNHQLGKVLWDVWCQDTLREFFHIPPGEVRKIIFKMHFSGDMLVPRRVFATHVILIILIVCCIIWLQLSFFNCSFHHDYC